MQCGDLHEESNLRLGAYVRKEPTYTWLHTSTKDLMKIEPNWTFLARSKKIDDNSMIDLVLSYNTNTIMN